MAKLAQLIPEAGAGVRNPVETTLGMGGAADFYKRGLDIVDADPQTDFILVHMAVDVYGGHQAGLHERVKYAADVLSDKAKSLTKPLAVALYTGGYLDTITTVLKIRDMLTRKKIPVYSGVEAASKAISKLIGYYESTRDNGNIA